MLRPLKLWWATLLIGLAACAPEVMPPSVLPTFVSTTELAQPAPNEAYPTSQAAESNASETVSGFSMNLRKVWQEGKQVNADLCFTLPDSSGWTINEAHFEYAGNVISEFSSTFLSMEDAQGGQPAQRCDELSFYVPPDADLSSSSLTVESIAASPPNAEEYCTLYKPKIQQALAERGTGITVDCPVVDGAMSFQIVGKPEGMSQEEAERLVFSEEFYTVRGPWTFLVTFGQ